MKCREYTKEFKQEAVTLSKEQDVNAAQVARELGIKPALLYRWRAEMRSDGAEAFPGKGKVKSSDEEVRELQRELNRVRMRHSGSLNYCNMAYSKPFSC